MLAALARGLRLSLEERDHLFRLAGYAIPQRALRADHLNPGMMRIFDGLEDAAAQVVNYLGETLKQTRLSKALLGDETRTHRDGPQHCTTDGSPTPPRGRSTPRTTTRRTAD